MANNIDKKEPVAICDQSKIDVTKCDNHELAGNIEPLIKVIGGQQRYERELLLSGKPQKSIKILPEAP